MDTAAVSQSRYCSTVVTFMTYIVSLSDREQEFLLGGKARAIAQLKQLGFLVPEGFVLSPKAFEASLTAEQSQAFFSSKNFSPDLQAMLVKLQPSEAVKQELRQALTELCPRGELVAVRSSANDEDGVLHSFAGQFDSFLNVPPEKVADKVAAVWRSAFSNRVLTYQQQRGLVTMPHPPAVLIQRMVNPTVAGVAFGADPVSGKRGVAVISAVYGLGRSLVSGESDADTYHVDREGRIIQRQIAVAISHKPTLDDEQILAIAKLVRQVGREFGRPQDIEWAIEKGCVYLLQSRPITSLSQMPDPDGVFNLWDNSNIAESYSGVTTPLTFSFARRAYEEVYRQFCRFMGVPQATIAQHHDTFSRMIGMIQGRVYYNLLSWYRVLALLPGFRVNRRFMEQMMGVRESLPESVVNQLQAATWQDRLQDSLRVLGTVFGLLTNYFRLPSRIKQFYLRLDEALHLPQDNLESWRADELAAYYRNIERQLLTRWDAPLINDFFAMIFYGFLQRLTQKWCGDRAGTLQNDLLAEEGGMISAEPALRMRAMADLAVENAQFVSLLSHGFLEEIEQEMSKLPQFKFQYQEYLKKFGDRCLEELKLESPTLQDDPLPLLRAIGQLSTVRTPNSPQVSPSPRKVAQQRVLNTLKSHPLRRLLFNWVLKNARNRVRERENLRFERTRVFGRARRVFVELGKRFYAQEKLQSPRDIFYLEVNEILAFIEGTATCTNLQGLVAVRQAEQAKYQEMPAPSDRFETRGIVYQGLESRDWGLEIGKISDQSNPSLYLQGIGCSPGIVRGPVRIITNPKQVLGKNSSVSLSPGTILVAKRTDPGWILLFSSSAGLLVERGSLLSHAAIVTRELGIPGIVSLPGVTQWLKDGDWVEMDGSSGKVCKIENHA